MKSEHLFDQPLVAWAKILDFLGLRFIPLPISAHANSGEGEAQSITGEIHDYLCRKLESTFVAMDNLYGISWY